MARLVSWLGGWLARAGMAIAARRRAFGVVVTNVPGPARPLELLGARLSALHPFVPLFPGQRLSIAVLRYDDRLFWGLTTGWRDRERGVRLEADLSHELAAFGSAERDERAA